MKTFRHMQAGSMTKLSDNGYAHKVANTLNDAVKSNASHLDEECAICLDPINVDCAVVTPCLHIFCKPCLMGALGERSNAQKREVMDKKEKGVSDLQDPQGPCPVCNETVVSSKILGLSQKQGKTQTDFLADSKNNLASRTREDESREFLEIAVQGTTSSKLTAIIQELHKIWDEDPGSKVLIFSQFLGFLDLLEKCLQSNGITSSRLDGKLSLKERVAVLDEFSKSRPIRADAKSDGKIGSVLLISMKAGGVGLNLVAASTVFIADPWWNAAVEDQCVNRIHRIGQAADKVRVRKFFMSNSVEERILELQKRKKYMANEALCGGAQGHGAGTRPALEDFKILFQD